MRGLFHSEREEAHTPCLIAMVNSMSARERSAWSKWLDARQGNGGGVRCWIPCFVFVDCITEYHDVKDFDLNMSNGTAFIETRTALNAGQKFKMVFPDSMKQGFTEFMGKVVWIGPKGLST